jgi:hypothetical protein
MALFDESLIYLSQSYFLQYRKNFMENLEALSFETWMDLAFRSVLA